MRVPDKDKKTHLDKSKYVDLEIVKDSRSDYSTKFTIPGLDSNGESVDQTYIVSITGSKVGYAFVDRKDYPVDQVKLPNVATLVFQNTSTGFSQPNLQMNSGQIFATVVKSAFDYIKKYRPSAFVFTPAHEGLRGSYYLMSSQIEKSVILVNPRYIFANPRSAKDSGGMYIIQEKYLELYKQAKEKEGLE